MATRTADADQVDRQARPATAGQAEANPLREGLRLERMAEPCTMVICGATGDLTERKLGPALYNAMLGGFLPPEFTVVGFARRDLGELVVEGPGALQVGAERLLDDDPCPSPARAASPPVAA